jgi:TRAP-type C4-dicarboxylate transport system permease large subunit
MVIGTLAYRTLTLKDLWRILDRAARTSASVYLIVGFATIISWILANERLPNELTTLVETWNLQPWMLLLILNVFFLINGLWVGDSVQLLLFAPLFTPILAAMGVSPVHFGVVMPFTWARPYRVSVWDESSASPSPSLLPTLSSCWWLLTCQRSPSSCLSSSAFFDGV